MLHEAREDARLLFDEVQHVRQQHPIDERGEVERAGDVRDDPIDMLNTRQGRQRLGVVVDGVDVSCGTESLEQRPCERPIAGADVRPGPTFVVDRAGDQVDRFARVQATAGVAGTFVRPRYARYSMIPLMITCGMFSSTFPMTSVPWRTPVTR